MARADLKKVTPEVTQRIIKVATVKAGLHTPSIRALSVRFNISYETIREILKRAGMRG